MNAKYLFCMSYDIKILICDNDAFKTRADILFLSRYPGVTVLKWRNLPQTLRQIPASGLKLYLYNNETNKNVRSQKRNSIHAMKVFDGHIHYSFIPIPLLYG